jgi:manganese oxidase
MNNRRGFLQQVLAMGAGAISVPRLFGQKASTSSELIRKEHYSGPGHGFNVAVQTPDISDLPFTLDNGVKVFNLVAEPVKQQIAPNKTLVLWGFNGSAPGPTIQVNQGDRVRIIVDNHLPEPTSMHWHGFEIPHSMDGGSGVSQEPIKPADASFTNSRCIRKELTSTTPIWRCRK